MKNIHSYSRIPLIFIALFGAVSDARASDTGDQVLDEVVVTATRKEESLQDVPLSVAAISGKAIEMSGSTVFGDIGFSVANFMTETSGHNPLIGNVTIRGISGRAAWAASPAPPWGRFSATWRTPSTGTACWRPAY